MRRVHTEIVNARDEQNAGEGATTRAGYPRVSCTKASSGSSMM